MPRQTFEVTDLAHWLALTVARDAIDDVRLRSGCDQPENEAVRVVVANTLTGEFSRAGLMRLRWPYVRRVFAQHLRQACPDLGEGELARNLAQLEDSYKRPFPQPNEDYLAGGLANTIAGRICNYFDFKGGGYTVDGACASSLLAVADGCTALLAGDADMVLAGGVDLSLDPFELVGFSRSAALAKHEMLVYDEQSEGFWPGEGCGFVVLMRYSDALEQCERIHAVVHGWGISSDGRGGLTRPESAGQQLALRRCYARAGYGPGSVAYFEGHGTGTKVGDAAELEALVAARNSSGGHLQEAVVSSVKANIGHTKAAAGLAGLLRATACVAEHVLPPTTGCRQPHPLLAEHAGNLTASAAPREWSAHHGPRLAGISAMGFGGINTHITIGEAPSLYRRPTGLTTSGGLHRLTTNQDAELFVFAASNARDLCWTIDHIAGIAPELSPAELTDLAVELARRACRPMLKTWKAAVVAAGPAELKAKLEHLRGLVENAGNEVLHLAVDESVFLSGCCRKGAIALVFPGQGVPCPSTGGAHARRFEEVARTYALRKPFSGDRRDTGFAHSAVITAELAGLRVLQRVGIEGDVAIGHSLGELSALHWAGCFSEDTLGELARARGRSIVDSEATSGAMAAIAAGQDRTARLIGDLKDVVVANINAPQQTVIAGCRAGVETAITRARRDGIATTPLHVRRAFHSPAMSQAASNFARTLDETVLGPPERSVLSTVTGDILDGGRSLKDHLRDQLVEPVQFLTAITKASAAVDLFLEVGPGHVMSDLIRATTDVPVASLDIAGDSLGPSLVAVGAAYVIGCAPALARLFEDRFARRFDWNWRPTFLQNPCEAFAGDDVASDGGDAAAVAVATPQPDEEAATGKAGNALERVRLALAEHTGLPSWTFENSSRMSADLHLNSITVSEIVARLAIAQGLPAPAEPMRYANASVEEIAEALDLLAEAPADAGRETAAVDGIARWTRAFEVVHMPARPLVPCGQLTSGLWEAFGSARAPAAGRLLERLHAGEWGQGVLVWVEPEPTPADVGAWLEAAQRCLEREEKAGERLRFVVVQHGWGAAGFARSFHLEHPELDVLVINLPAGYETDAEQWVLRELGADIGGFREVFLNASGEREEPFWRKLDTPASTAGAALGEHDVLLVTGGGRGITAECAFQLAQRTRCQLLILGRSAPDRSPELANNLGRLRSAGVKVSYQTADVTNLAATLEAVAAGTAELGSRVTGILHGAGSNRPRPVADLSSAELEATLAPKVYGLKHVLAAVEESQLKLLCTFSSIIGSMGLEGESHYALANEWLSRQTESFKQRHPTCRTSALEWSAWSGLGMGERLGSITGLERRGVATISLDDGLRKFLQLMEGSDLPVRVIVAGRFGAPRTVNYERARPTQLRFLHSVLVDYPGIELVVECELSRESDGYVDDHVLDGQHLFPAVMALEAMAQAALALLGRTASGADLQFQDVSFLAPIIVPASNEEAISMRVLALAEPDGQIQLAIRCASTAFQMNHVEARCRVRDSDESPDNRCASDIVHGPQMSIPPNADLRSFEPRRSLYGSILFQSGRFQRIERYQLVEARRCSSRLSGDPAATWFTDDLPQAMLLGDAGTRDAAVHSVQACIPHEILIPTGVEQIDAGVLDPSRTYHACATELADRGDELLYDVTIFDTRQRPVERWRNVTFRIVSHSPPRRFDSITLLAPYLERKLAASDSAAHVHATLEWATREGRAHKGRLDVDHRPDGKPDSSCGTRFRSAAYAREWRIALEADLPVGCDLEEIEPRDCALWEGLLGPAGLKLALIVAEVVGEDLAVSATRVWAVHEAIHKLGSATGTPVLIGHESGADWVVFRSGRATVYTSVSAAGDEPAMCAAAAVAGYERPVGEEAPEARKA